MSDKDNYQGDLSELISLMESCSAILDQILTDIDVGTHDPSNQSVSLLFQIAKDFIAVRDRIDQLPWNVPDDAAISRSREAATAAREHLLLGDVAKQDFPATLLDVLKTHSQLLLTDQLTKTVLEHIEAVRCKSEKEFEEVEQLRHWNETLEERAKALTALKNYMRNDRNAHCEP